MNRNMLIIFAALFLGFQSAAQDTLIKTELKAYIQQRVEKGTNPSIAMAAVNGKKVEFFNYGTTKINEGNDVSNSTVYEIGSISKVFTCIILADEVIKGRMALDDPISKYLPTHVKVPTRNKQEITLKDLATHTSALPRMPTNFNPADMENPFADYTVDDLYNFLGSYSLPRDIGVQYEYSNVGTGLLGHILELHTGKSYEELVIERIANPLDMTDTKIEFSERMLENLALGYNSELEVTKNWDIPILGGAGALRSTTTDMVKFLKANMTDDGSDLSKAMKLSHRVHFSTDDKSFKIGLGWHYANNNTITWHNGGTGGYRAFAGFVAEKNEAVVVLTNSTYSVDGVGLVQLGQDLELEMPKKVVYPKIVEVEESVLETYVGTYELMPTFSITITRDQNQLSAQATGQQKFKIFASSENEFFYKVVEATITFNKDSSGAVESLTLNQNGQNLLARKTN